MNPHPNLFNHNGVWYFHAKKDGVQVSKSTRTSSLPHAMQIRDDWMVGLLTDKWCPKVKNPVIDDFVNAYFMIRWKSPKYETRHQNVANLGKILDSYGMSFMNRLPDIDDAFRFFRDNSDLRPNSINTIMRSAKSIFSERACDHYRGKGLDPAGADALYKVSYLPQTAPEGLPPVSIMEELDNRAGYDLRTGDLRKAWILVRYCGLRNSEIIDLLIDNVVLYEGRSWIEVKNTKTGKDRRVPIRAQFRNELLGNDSFVLSGPRTRRRNTVSRELSKWARQIIPADYKKTVYALSLIHI